MLVAASPRSMEGLPNRDLQDNQVTSSERLNSEEESLGEINRLQPIEKVMVNMQSAAAKWKQLKTKANGMRDSFDDGIGAKGVAQRQREPKKSLD